MTKNERHRRVIILCCHFMRNLAYYRAAPKRKTLESKGSFWVGINGNCLEIGILEWCKLFGDKKDPHHWRKIVSDTDSFNLGLLELVGGEEYFNTYIDKVRTYRDKFIAHLDNELIANIPEMDVAFISASYYHAHVVNNEMQEGVIGNLPKDIKTFYEDRLNEAKPEYT